MHELALAQSVVSIVENAALQNHVEKVVTVKLIVGQLAGVEMRSFQQGLKVASHGTCMEEAQFIYERPSGTAWCMQCCKTVPLHRLGEACPECGGYQLQVNGGNEFKVGEIELSTDSDD